MNTILTLHVILTGLVGMRTTWLWLDDLPSYRSAVEFWGCMLTGICIGLGAGMIWPAVVTFEIYRWWKEK